MNRLENFLLMASVQAILVSIALLLLVIVVKALFRQRANGLIMSGFVVMIAIWLFAMAPLPNWSSAWLNSAEHDNTPVVTAETDRSDISPTANQSVDQQTVESTESRFASDIALPSSNVSVQPNGGQLSQWFKNSLRNFSELAAAPPATTSPWNNWKTWFAIFALTGMVIGALRLLFAMVAIQRLKKLGTKVLDPQLHEALDIVRAKLGFVRPLEIRETPETTAAFTVGWRKPLIFISSDWTSWDENQTTATLAHEVAHISNGDFLQRIVAQISTVLNFYNPIVHVLCAQLNLEQELSADDRAASVVGGRQSYLGVLAAMALKTEYPEGRLSPMFLPTRKTFFRRIEMLRKTTSLSNPTWETQRRNWASVLAVIFVCLLGVGIAGLRLPTANAVIQEVVDFAEPGSTSTAQPAIEANLRFAPADADVVFVMRANQIMDNKVVKVIFDQIEVGDLAKPDINMFENQTGVTHRQLDQITTVASAAGPGQGFVVIVQSIEDGWWAKDTRAEEFKKRFDAVKIDAFRDYEIFKGISTRGTTESFWCAADAKTLLWCTNLQMLKASLREPEGPRSRGWSDHWKTHSTDLLSIYIGPEFIETFSNEPKENLFLEVLSPFWEQTNYAIGGVTFGDENLVKVLASCATDQGANEVSDTIKGMVPLAKNFIRGSQQLKELPKELTNLVLELLDSTKVETDANTVSASMKLESDPTSLVKLVTPLVLRTRAAARRTDSLNNMRQLGLGMLNYESVYRHFPPAVLTSPEGKKYSWRIAILPFVEQDALYNAYRFDEEWNSPHNTKITANIPPLFRHSSSASSTACCYFVVTGAETMFPLDNKPIGFGSITDGSSNTLMLVESKQDIHWAEPRDLSFDDKGLLESLGGFEKDGTFAATFGDCSTWHLSKSMGKNLLTELLTRAGGEIVDHDQLKNQN